MVHQFRVFRFLYRKKLEVKGTQMWYMCLAHLKGVAPFSHGCVCVRENESHGQVQEVKFCFISR